jgi:hypothetical protein
VNSHFRPSTSTVAGGRAEIGVGRGENRELFSVLISLSINLLKEVVNVDGVILNLDFPLGNTEGFRLFQVLVAAKSIVDAMGSIWHTPPRKSRRARRTCTWCEACGIAS